MRGAVFEFADRGFQKLVGEARVVGACLTRRAARTGFLGQVIAVAAAPRAIDLRLFPARKAIEARANCVQSFVAIEIIRVDALLGGLIGDDLVEPFAERHASPPRRFLGGFAGFPTDTPDAPRSGSVHVFNRRRGSSNHCASGSLWRHERMFRRPW